jgi:uncharacterized alkaline shock family protein YloU
VSSVAGGEVVREVAVAAAVAEAVRALPGVARLQPRLWGLVQQVTRDLWERATGGRYPDIGGVEVTLHPDGVTMEIGLVVRAEFTAAKVAVAVQHAAAAAATAASGLPVTSVAVHISDVERARTAAR